VLEQLGQGKQVVASAGGGETAGDAVEEVVLEVLKVVIVEGLAIVLVVMEVLMVVKLEEEEAEVR
jgi:hypothetical protein